jgi:membrane fusion protein (multidrug efflux system)
MNKPLSILLLLCNVFFSCQHKPPPPPVAVPVNVYQATAQTVVYYDKYPSTTQALSQVELRPEVQGYITAILFKEGESVKKGQVLYEIDKRLYEANYEAAMANVKVAEGNQAQAKQDADRYSYLSSHNAIAKQVLDHAVISLQNTDNQVKAAQDAEKTAKTNLTYATIYAPFDGTIGFSQVKLGDMVSAGSTVLNTVSTIDPVAVDFLINEKQLPRFEQLKTGKKKHPDSLFTLLLPDNSPYSSNGKISVIDRAVDPQTGSIRIRLVFSNPDYTLKAGMSCVVRVHNQEGSPQLLIPGKAIVEQMGEYFVFIVKDTALSVSSDSTQKSDSGSNVISDTSRGRRKWIAFQKKVQVGQVIGPNQVIRSGIADGDQVVVDGVQSLHDGSEVTLATRKPSSLKGKKADE